MIQLIVVCLIVGMAFVSTGWWLYRKIKRTAGGCYNGMPSSTASCCCSLGKGKGHPNE